MTGLMGRVPEVLHSVLLALPAVVVQLLNEIATVVEQADRHQGDVQPAGRLEMVPGEDAQAARIDGKTRGKSILHAEVSPRRWRRAQGGVSGTSPVRSCIAADLPGRRPDATGRRYRWRPARASRETRGAAEAPGCPRISPASPGRGAGKACTSAYPRSNGGCRRVPPDRSDGRGCEDRRRTDGSFAWAHYPTRSPAGAPPCPARL